MYFYLFYLCTISFTSNGGVLSTLIVSNEVGKLKYAVGSEIISFMKLTPDKAKTQEFTDTMQ